MAVGQVGKRGGLVAALIVACGVVARIGAAAPPLEPRQVDTEHARTDRPCRRRGCWTIRRRWWARV